MDFLGISSSHAWLVLIHHRRQVYLLAVSAKLLVDPDMLANDVDLGFLGISDIQAWVLLPEATVQRSRSSLAAS